MFCFVGFIVDQINFVFGLVYVYVQEDLGYGYYLFGRFYIIEKMVFFKNIFKIRE